MKFCELSGGIIIYGLRRMIKTIIFVVAVSDGIYVRFCVLAFKLLLPPFAKTGTIYFSRRGIMCSNCI